MNRILFKRFLVFLTVILTVAVMTFALTACSFATTDGSKDNTSNVTDDDKDNTGEVTDDGNGDIDAGGNEEGNDEGGADGDETTPEEPENPEEPVEPADPEEPEPEPEPEPTPEPEPDPEDPDEDTAPADITEVETIDELLLFADEATAILNENYLDELALKLIGKGMTADDFKNATFEWMIVDYEDNIINQLQVKVHFDLGTSTYFKVGKVEFNQGYNVKQILNGKATDYTVSKIYQDPQILKENITINAELGNLVINVVNGTDTTTQNEGDIWCSISGTVIPKDGKEYRTITVYQIVENCVKKYSLSAEAPTVKVDEIIQNINDGKYRGTPTCETEYTFTGIVIE